MLYIRQPDTAFDVPLNKAGKPLGRATEKVRDEARGAGIGGYGLGCGKAGKRNEQRLEAA